MYIFKHGGLPTCQKPVSRKEFSYHIQKADNLPPLSKQAALLLFVSNMCYRYIHENAKQ